MDKGTAMQVKQLDHLNLSVINFEETAEWYRRMLGFEIVEQGIQHGQPWGVIKNGDAMLCIYQHPDWGGHDKDAIGEAGFQRVSHFALRITDRAQWEAVMKREKPKLYYGGEVNWPHSSAWYIQDPNGYEIEIALWDEGPKFD
jgi:catechol 2,3-dioxygenase-like lactoylglutathione lyase family enzyme